MSKAVRPGDDTPKRNPAALLGGLLDSWIEDHGSSQIWFAAKIGVHQQTLAEWRRGKVRAVPGPDVIDRIAALTQTPYTEVLHAALADCGYKPQHARGSSTGDAALEKAHQDILHGLSIIAKARESIAAVKEA